MNIFSVFMMSVFICISLFGIPAYTGDKDYKPYTDIGYIEKSAITIEQVVDNPDKYHRDIITLDGAITRIDYKKIITGRKFTIFKLSDGTENEINVYARGHIKEIDRGTRIRIEGRYSKEKSFLFTTYHNVMKARKVYILKS